LDGLARKRAAIHHHVQSHKVLVAPVRRVPPEILSEILRNGWILSLYLVTALNSIKPLFSLEAFVGGGGPLPCLLQRLWTMFTLTLRPKYLKYNVLLAKTWLGRPGTCPLSIMLESNQKYHAPVDAGLPALLRALVRHSLLCTPQPVMHALSSAKKTASRCYKDFTSISGSQ